MTSTDSTRKGLLTRLFQATHGERPGRVDLLATHGGAAGAAAIAAVVAKGWAPGITWLQLVLLFLVAYDLAGGAISNRSQPVDRHYAGQPLKMRLLFLVGHSLYPILLWVLFGAEMGRYAAMCYMAALVGGAATLLVPKRNQGSVALACVVLGLVLMSLWPAPVGYLAWFGPLLLIKLAYSYPVTHFEPERQG